MILVILNVVLLVMLLLVILLILFFLAYILAPAVANQTRIEDNILFAGFEHDSDGGAEDADAPSKMRAAVMCRHAKEFGRPYDVRLVRGQSCSSIYLTYGSVNDCAASCIGLGDCTKACGKGAIFIQNGTAVVSALCNGCGKCVSACPKGVIQMVPWELERTALCRNSGRAMTSCSCCQMEGNIERALQKHFKMWQSCYRMLKGKR